MKQKLLKLFYFITNPRLLLCFGMAWMITNGWSYVLTGLGVWLGIGWMTAVGSAYLTFLWLPVSPEKLITFAIAIALLRFLFPNDQKTLAVLREGRDKIKASIQHKKQKRKQKKENRP